MLLVTLGVGLLLGAELYCCQVGAFSSLHSTNLVNVRVIVPLGSDVVCVGTVVWIGGSYWNGVTGDVDVIACDRR